MPVIYFFLKQGTVCSFDAQHLKLVLQSKFTILERAVSARPFLPRPDSYAGCQVEGIERVQDELGSTLYFGKCAVILFNNDKLWRVLCCKLVSYGILL